MSYLSGSLGLFSETKTSYFVVKEYVDAASVFIRRRMILPAL
jgi:hypothetical protein